MKPIGTIIRSIFGADQVPAEPTIEQALQLLAQAEEQEQAAQFDVASKASLLETVLSDAAMAPDDPAQRNAAGTAAVAHRKAKDLLEQAQALVRGARSKLEAAQRREAAQKRAEFEDVVNEKLRQVVAVATIAERNIASLPVVVLAIAQLHEELRTLAPAAVHELPLLLGATYRAAIARIASAAIMGERPPGHALAIAADVVAVVRRNLAIPEPAPVDSASDKAA